LIELALVLSLVGIGWTFYANRSLLKRDAGSQKMQEIASAIAEGASVYLKRQNKNLAVFVAFISLVIGATLGILPALTYILGCLVTSIAAYLGMMTAVKANVRTAQAAKKEIKEALPIAFFGGSVMGFSTVSFSLLSIALLYISLRNPFLTLTFSAGASTLAMFAKAGGGIYTKTADISADLVGKIEKNIPEDDPRNPAVIADNVGDNVGDVAGMGADLTDSFIASIVATMIIGAENGEEILTVLPLAIAAMGLFASLIGVIAVKKCIKDNPKTALDKGSFITWTVFVLLLFFISYFSGLRGNRWLGIFLPTVAGFIAGIIIGITSDYFTSIDRMPVRKVAKASEAGAAINILTGFSYGIISIAAPIIGICLATLAAWNFAQIFGVNPYYGIAISAVGMLSTVAMTISADAFGPIADNAKGIAEQSGLEEKVVEVLDELDAAGNTTKAITKGFAIGAAALTVLALFQAYAHLVDIETLDLIKPEVVVGIFLGGMIPPLLSALLILAVGKNAERMIEEIRRQFKEIPGLIEGKAKPDYKKCIEIATMGALKELIPPCSLAILSPILTMVLGKEALGGFLAGSIVTGIIFALLMANSGGLWDNAKKYIEAGAFGGKGSEAHKAAVTGDTVGDPFKDTAGPSLNTMITVMSLISSIFAPLFFKSALI